MLNISANRISVDKQRLPALSSIQERTTTRYMRNFLVVISVIFAASMFLPWTQNIMSKGVVTTLKPAQRPQSIPTLISGRIDNWLVREGQFVRMGDTLAIVSEIENEYLDPNLLSRQEDQITAKASTQSAYQNKTEALWEQSQNLLLGMEIKLTQAQNLVEQMQFKVRSDSSKLLAAQNDYEISQRQYARFQDLFDKGLKSRTELESRQLIFQKSLADQVVAENALLASRNGLLNAIASLQAIQADTRKEFAKIEADRFSAISEAFKVEAELTKMQNQLANLVQRRQNYTVVAPQSGFVVKTLKAGIGETVKAGEEIVMIMPSDYDLAVEIFVRPLDLPLLQEGQKVRLQFDGWPAVVFSGWPETSYGTFGGEVFAIDRVAGKDGLFRVLVAADPEAEAWPEALRPGGGAFGMILLNDVPLWYELWRQINGFPPDFYS